MKLKKGQKVRREVCGPGDLVSGEEAVIERVDKKGVWLETTHHPDGPYDPKTGWHSDNMFGMRRRIVLGPAKAAKASKAKTQEEVDEEYNLLHDEENELGP
jgi:hypothetical protein